MQNKQIILDSFNPSLEIKYIGETNPFLSTAVKSETREAQAIL